MLAAVASFAAMDALMKLLVARYLPLQVASMRGFAALPFVLAPIAFRLRGAHHLLVKWSQAAQAGDYLVVGVTAR